MLVANQSNDHTKLQSAWNADLIRRYDLAGPRYTSYPTAVQFLPFFNETTLIDAVKRSNLANKPVSLYFHIPFCQSLCYYCGCNKIVTNNKSRALPYVQYMIQELSLYASLLSTERRVTQLHWGGGTPSYLNDHEMSLLMNATKNLFTIVDDDSREFSIEIHPGNMHRDRISHLRELGFNRISMGIQDFDPHVQKAVNRYNTYDDIVCLTEKIHSEGFKSINVDLIYGLPLQSINTFSDTLDKVIELSPDRLSVFNYAHMPHLFKSQQLINAEDLPSAEEKLDILHMTIEKLQTVGYTYIGMDHFAKANDDLVIAQNQKKLHRNFQGYSTQADCDLIAVGVSSISMIDDIYVQNEKDIHAYQQKLALELIPITKGIRLNEEDKIRRHIINQLMCHFYLDFDELKQLFNLDAKTYFLPELKQLYGMEEDGLLTINDNGITITDSGRLLVRRICMVFDEYLKPTQETAADQRIRYSNII